MADSNDYVFRTRWQVEATIEEVSDVLGDVAALPRWWPAVYLDVKILEPGDPFAVDKIIVFLRAPQCRGAQLLGVSSEPHTNLREL